MKKIIFSEIDKKIAELNSFIYTNPELGYQEIKACKKNIEIFSQMNFKCSVPYPSELPSAFKIEFGEGDKIVAFMSEYDALKDLGHACGHNLIATAAAKAFVETAKCMQENELSGRIVLIGTPAEENFGGKVDLINLGFFDNIDLALISHPHNSTCCSKGAVAVSRFDVIFRGKSAHASIDPDSGINALDAMIVLFNSVGLKRQQMDSKSQIHGIITNGGVAPNIIPDYTEAFFYLRADQDEKLEKLIEQFEDMVKGAALTSGCEWVLRERNHSYSTEKINLPLKEEVRVQLRENMSDFSKEELMISSDYANVSQIVPTVNFFFNITGEREEIPLHSTEFRNSAGSSFAFEQALKCGSILSNLALKYLTDLKFQQEVDTDFVS